MTATATRRTCSSCGAYLARDNTGEICSPCLASRARQAPPARVLEPEAILYAIAASLLMARALDPARRVYLRAELAEQGIETDHVEIFQAVQKLRRRGLAIEADERQPGHRLIGWSHRFRRRARGRRLLRRPQLSLFE